MKAYLKVMREILEKGHQKGDRTGTGTLSLFGKQMRFDLLRGEFPLVTTKNTHLRSIIYELLWFLKGSDNKNWLNENGVTIWDEWADEDGYLGPIYGYQWRSWPKSHYEHIDQIGEVIRKLRMNPEDRRMIVSAWNVGMIEQMRLPPCHLLFQFYSHELSLADRVRLFIPKRYPQTSRPGKMLKSMLGTCQGGDVLFEAGLVQNMDRFLIPRRGLSCQMYQRSCDWFLGVPFNIASYALLTMMVAQVTGHAPYEFIWTGGDCHLYSNHIEQAKEQLSRKPYHLPRMEINGTVKNIVKFDFTDFTLTGYEHHPAIKAPIAI